MLLSYPASLLCKRPLTHLQCLRYVQARHPQGLSSEPAIATIAAAVLNALAYLHSVGYMHRDVKVGLATASGPLSA